MEDKVEVNTDQVERPPGWYRQKRRASLVRILIAFLVASGFALNLWVASSIRIDDFSGFYTGAALVGTPQLYSAPAVLRFQHDVLGIASPENLAVRIPAYFLLLSPFAKIPYGTARTLWTAIMSLFALGFALSFRGGYRLWAIVLTSFPIMESIATGQDTALYLLALGLAFRANRARHDFLAGFLLSLLLFKFHLAALVPPVLLIRREWRLLVGMTSGVLAILVASFAAGGLNWIPAYIQILASLDPAGSKIISIMPNIRALVSAAHLPGITELIIALPVAGVALLAAWRTSTWRGIAAALIAGVLFGHHTHVQDSALIIPAILWSFDARNELARITGAILTTPFLYIAAIAGAGAALAIVLTSHLAVFGCARDQTEADALAGSFGGSADSCPAIRISE